MELSPLNRKQQQHQFQRSIQYDVGSNNTTINQMTATAHGQQFKELERKRHSFCLQKQLSSFNELFDDFMRVPMAGWIQSFGARRNRTC
jgi:hypothetical protein